MKAEHTRTFYVKFYRNGEIEPRVIYYRDTSIVGAFEKTLRRFPDAKLIEGWTESFYEGERAFTKYTPPSTARIAPVLAPQWKQTVFNFFEEISILQNRNQQATALILTLQPSQKIN
jgi:hypothetical protein